MLGDPAKAAQAILHIAGVPQPPLRLLLGSDAAHLAQRLHEARTAEDAKWRALSVTTDADDADADEWCAAIDRLRIVATAGND